MAKGGFGFSPRAPPRAAVLLLPREHPARRRVDHVAQAIIPVAGELHPNRRVGAGGLVLAAVVIGAGLVDGLGDGDLVPGARDVFRGEEVDGGGDVGEAGVGRGHDDVVRGVGGVVGGVGPGACAAVAAAQDRVVAIEAVGAVVAVVYDVDEAGRVLAEGEVLDVHLFEGLLGRGQAGGGGLLPGRGVDGEDGGVRGGPGEVERHEGGAPYVELVEGAGEAVIAAGGGSGEAGGGGAGGALGEGGDGGEGGEEGEGGLGIHGRERLVVQTFGGGVVMSWRSRSGVTEIWSTGRQLGGDGVSMSGVNPC